MKIKLTWPGGEATGVLNESPGAKAVWNALPQSASANTWGEEVYFRLPAKMSLAPDATDVVEPGTICYWTQGASLALPFGPTPVSHGDECRLVTAVNILGKLDGDPRVLSGIRDGMIVTVERAN